MQLSHFGPIKPAKSCIGGESGAGNLSMHSIKFTRNPKREFNPTGRSSSASDRGVGMRSIKFALRLALLVPVLFGLTGCLSFLGLTGDSIPPSERQLPASAQALLALKGMKPEAPIFVRIFKEESELEVWKLKDGYFQLFRTYPICAWSGTLGPKVLQGDKQAPEGFYTVSRGQMNPHSLYHLAFNIGFPNSYDRANGYTGSALMVHGNCKSAGCYAMTDAYIEEIYILAREAFNGGQTRFHVHAYPFRMTAENMQRHRDNPWYPFWAKLKEGYDSFEASGKTPVVKVCSKQYLVNVSFPGQSADPEPDAPCPLYAKIDPKHMPGMDGIPPTLLAAFKKPETAQPADAAARPAVLASNAQPSAPQMQPVAAVGVNMSASPVITRSSPLHPSTVIANMQPAPPTAAAPVSAKAPVAAVQPSPVRVAAALQPPAYEAQPAPAAAATPTPLQSGDTASKEVDPDALQKPNRSGKGGKLPSPPQ
jgi:murein L,D-transpeptidase YafK